MRLLLDLQGNARNPLHVERPFAGAHHGLAPAILSDAIDIHRRGTDHEVDVGHAGVPTRGVELLVSEFLTARESEAVGAADRNVTGGVLIEESVIEEVTAPGNRGTDRHKSHFPEAG